MGAPPALSSSGQLARNFHVLLQDVIGAIAPTPTGVELGGASKQKAVCIRAPPGPSIAMLEHWCLWALLGTCALTGTACLVSLYRNIEQSKRHLEELERARHQAARPVDPRAITARELRLSAEKQMSRVEGLIGGLAHSIGNPLAILSMNLDVIEASLRRSDCTDFDAHISDMRGALNRVGAFLHDLTALSAPNGTRHGSVDVNEILRGLIHVLRLNEQSRNTSFSMDLSPDTAPLPITRRLLVLSLFFILNAAAESVREVGGRIEVATSMSGASDVLVVRVACSVIAPPGSSHAPRLAVPRESGHLGVGTARRIIESMDGSMKMSAVESGGIVFDLALPRESAVHATAAPA